jgi:hypothetical protein
MEAYLTIGLVLASGTVGYVAGIRTRQQRYIDVIKRAATNEAFAAGVWVRSK